MGKRNIIALVLAFCLVLGLSGCGEKQAAVYVQSVASLAAMGGIAPGDRFPGIVVSENVAEINKDSERTVEELLVREGDDVTEGQVLFRYDVDQLTLTLEKQRLELEQLLASIESYQEQIKELEQDRARAPQSEKLEYTVQIQSLEVDLKEAELNVQAKEREIAHSEEILENAEVVSPVTGRVQTISENGTDNYGNPLPYITIQQSGSYRIKGSLGELQRGGITEGSRLRILSRTDPDAVWYGTVTLVDYESPTQGNQNEMYYGTSADPMTASSKYPFYVELDSTEGLLLGQHVYLEVDVPEDSSGISIGASFVMVEPDGSAWVWAESGRGRLEKRQIQVGEYNPMNDTYRVEEGLEEEDFIAFPDPERCKEGTPVTHEMTDPGMEGGA